MLGVEGCTLPTLQGMEQVAVWIKERAKVRVGAGAHEVLGMVLGMVLGVSLQGKGLSAYLPLQQSECCI